MEKVEALGVTFEEIKERTGLSKDFVISAVVNGSFPGSYKITECGKRYIYVPRGAFEDYMTKWHREPLSHSSVDNCVQQKYKKRHCANST